MDLIYYRGLNCRLASIINIANMLGVNYLDAYATLWSETDFTDEVKYNIYVSKRVFINLETIGVVTDMLDCDEMRAAESLSQIPDGEWFLVGMDTFYIPWHPVYGYFHDFHYFFARKETAYSFLCFDPVYNEKNKIIKPGDVFPAAFELSHVYRIDSNAPGKELAQEAREVLNRHPVTKEALLAEMLRCKAGERDSISLLIKQIIAIINNRYLFQHFFRNAVSDSGHYEHFFGDTFFLKWEAVRNGLYKALIVKDNKSVIDEVYNLFADLMNEEINTAKEILITSH